MTPSRNTKAQRIHAKAQRIHDEILARAQRLRNDPAYQALRAKAKEEMASTGTISPATMASLMGAKVI